MIALVDDRTLAGMIDHTLLKPEATPAQIEQLCREAVEHGFATVRVNGAGVQLGAGLVAGTGRGVAAAEGAAFVKTATGFGPAGATGDDVALMRKTVGDAVGVKAAGGIRTREAAEAMIEAGATRLGTSSSVLIVQGGRIRRRSEG